MLTSCPTDGRKMQLFANFVLVFLKMSGFCNAFSLRFFKFFVFPPTILIFAVTANSPLCPCDFSSYEVQAFASVKSVANVFTSQLIVDNIVVGQKPRYSTPTSSISFILGLEILYFKILPSLSQETTSMSRKIRNWWETVV